MPSFSSACMIPNRKSLRRRRRALTQSQQRDHARRAAQLVAHQPFFLRAQRIGFYLAADGELDPLPLIERALAMGKQCCLPVLHPLGHKRLWFAPWRPGQPLRHNSYHIPEPVWQRAGVIDPRSLELVILPLVAFDHHCNRMGMGAGFYDRTFARRLTNNYWKGPTLVGYAHALQQLPRVEKHPWDVPLDAVVTEKRVFVSAQ